jgi:RimJ/RimL family protein N-acetyltransferase
VDYFFAPDRIDLPEFTLRSYEPGDGLLLAESAKRSFDHLRVFLTEWPPDNFDHDAAEQLVRTWRARYLLSEDFRLGIFSPDGKQTFGGTGFYLRGEPYSRRNAEIGMWIDVDYSGKGYATKVLSAMLRWGFKAWPWQRLSWKCDTRNIASMRVAEKAGLQREGCLRQDYPLKDGIERRDTYIYATLRDEWLAQHRD